MTKTWSFNCYKGGTGKTNTSLNCAVQLARIGNNVSLLDFDFLGPVLFTIFGI
ncbi:MAG: P-loop NTPase [Candidatus Hodarchaeales archaeon]